MPGQLVTLLPDLIDPALAQLDDIEGVDRGLFVRAEVECLEGTRCWTYRWPGPTEGFERIAGPW